jgi:predicted nucleic acid-binding protein
MFLDTTILVEILRGNQKVINYVERAAEKEPLLFSVVQIGELADWCHLNNLDPLRVLQDVKNIVTPVGITESICLEGSKIKKEQREAGKKKFSLIDGIIAASAISLEQKLLTLDRDFEGLENVVLL